MEATEAIDGRTGPKIGTRKGSSPEASDRYNDSNEVSEQAGEDSIVGEQKERGILRKSVREQNE